ncbi:MAG: hypothetical protein U0527_00045 [Candidatus Eisenbacteria bacterium]
MKRSSRLLHDPRWFERGLLFTLGALLLSGPVQAASVEEDDEESIPSDMSFSVPAEVLAAKKDLAGQNGFSLLFGASAFVGTDANIYRSPTSSEHDSRAWGNWGYLRSDARWKRNRMLTTVNWKQTQYPGHSAVNANYGHVSNWISRPLGRRLGLEIDLDLSHQNDDAVRIDGTKYDRRYGYWRSSAEAVLEWNPGRHHRLRLSGEGLRKNYDETPALNSLDWHQLAGRAEYRYRFASSHYLDWGYAVASRRYREEPASVRAGDELPTNPSEHHRYREATVGYNLPIASGASLHSSFVYSDKRDLFQGYENFRRRLGSVGVDLRVTSALSLSADAERAGTDYDHLRGDHGQALRYDTWDLRLGSRLRGNQSCWLFGSVGYYERRSNGRSARSTATTTGSSRGSA